jgi:hypothetical protein
VGTNVGGDACLVYDEHLVEASLGADVDLGSGVDQGDQSGPIPAVHFVAGRPPQMGDVVVRLEVSVKPDVSDLDRHDGPPSRQHARARRSRAVYRALWVATEIHTRMGLSNSTIQDNRSLAVAVGRDILERISAPATAP